MALAIRWFPRIVRIAVILANASDEVVARRHLSAKQELLRILELLPPEAGTFAHVELLLSLVYLRLGHLAAAADMALAGIRSAWPPRRSTSVADRDFLLFVGKLIYERATKGSEQPMTVNVGVQLEDLRLDRVRESFKDEFPLGELVPAEVGRAN